MVAESPSFEQGGPVCDGNNGMTMRGPVREVFVKIPSKNCCQLVPLCTESL